MFAAATRAWYLPTCLNCATPMQSPIAYTPSAAASRSSTSIPRRPIVTPSCSSPRPSANGRRPAARRSRSASSVSPSSSVSRTPGSTLVTAAPRRTSIPSSAKTRSTIAPASASTRGSRRGAVWINVTRAPTRAKNCASSHPTAPPPRTARLAGTSVVSVAPSFVQYSIASRPRIVGITGTEPVAMTSRSYGSSCPSTSTAPGSRTRPRPRTNSARWPASHSIWRESSRSSTTWSRHQKTRSTSTSGIATPGAWRAAPTSSVARSIVFVGMHAQYEHSPPTSRLSTRVISQSASSRRRAPTKCSPVDPPPRTTTRKPLLQVVRLQEGRRHLRRGLLVDDHGLVHRDHRLQRQLRADRVDGLREPLPVRLRDLLRDDRGDVLEAEDVLRVGQDRVLPARELRVGREDVPCIDLPVVEGGVDADPRQ